MATGTINGQTNNVVVTRIKDIDALDKLLFFGIIFFVFILIYLAKFEENDGQTFQVISGLITGFAGAFFGRMKPKGDTTKPDTSTVTPTVITPPTSTTGGVSGATN